VSAIVATDAAIFVPTAAGCADLQSTSQTIAMTVGARLWRLQHSRKNWPCGMTLRQESRIIPPLAAH
jgi:hypothetical protein